MEDGHIIGIHVEGINNLKERYRQKKDVEDRLSAVEESIDAAIASVRYSVHTMYSGNPKLF